MSNGGGNGVSTLPQKGTRPKGIASFGIILTPLFAKQEQDRFGMPCANDNGPLLSALGIESMIDYRRLSHMEPKRLYSFNSAANNLDPFYKSDTVMRFAWLDGIPAWASPTHTTHDYTNPS